MIPEVPAYFEKLKNIPFREITHSREDAKRIVTEKTQQRARNIVNHILTDSFGPATMLVHTYARNGYIDSLVERNVHNGGRVFRESDIDQFYATIGNFTYKEIIDRMASQMARRAKENIPGQDGGIPGAREYLGGMLDALDFINLGNEARGHGITMIAESLHEQGVSAYDIGFGIHQLERPLFRTTGIGEEITFPNVHELRMDPDNAVILKRVYLSQARKKDTQEYFKKGEQSAKQARIVLTPSGNQLQN